MAGGTATITKNTMSSNGGGCPLGYWVPGTETVVYEFRQWGTGPNGNYSSHQTVTATACIQELSSDGHVLSQVKGNTLTCASNTPLVLDLNGDGVHTVEARHGVQFDFTGASADELSLGAAISTATSEGNTLGLVSSFTTADSASHAMADVWFASTSQTAVTAGLDSGGHDLDTLLANAGLTQAAASATAKTTDVEGHGHHHAGYTLPSSTVVAHHEWAH